MRIPTLFFPRAWLFVIVFALGFLVWTNRDRIHHIDYVANAAGVAMTPEAASETGYAGGVRHFLGTGHSSESYQWIAQTQKMLARGDWHIRQVDYDNIPQGRAVTTSSLYRWWLAALAKIHHAITGQPLGVSVERAGIFADPLLHIFLLIGTTVFVARRFGGFSAALVCIGLAVAFPFASWFAAGQPQEIGLQLMAALWSVLPLLIVGIAPDGERQLRRDFFTGGVFGGIGLWLNVGCQLPVLAGLVMGALTAAILSRRKTPAPELPWRSWSVGGAVACLGAYVIDFNGPVDLGLRLDLIHPLHGLAWLGVGELLARADRRIRLGRQTTTRRDRTIIILAAVAVTLPLVLAVRARHEWFVSNPSSLRLTAFIESAIAQDLGALITRDGFSTMLAATLLPLVLILPAGWLLARSADAQVRSSILLALGPVAVTAILACFHLQWWAWLDATLLALLAAGAAAVGAKTSQRLNPWWWSGGVVIMAIPALMLLIPPREGIEAVNELEVESLIERDLAHWLTQRAGSGRAAILASPDLAASLAFAGGFRTLGSPYFENREGLTASLRIAGSTSQDEALALVQRREITHIVLASWDPALERLAELGGDKEQKSLVALLHRWLPPRWLKPVPYRTPKISGFEAQTVTVFEVVELQDNSVALSHLADYFAETEQFDLASSAAAALSRSFPDDLGATVARVQAAAALRDQRTANEAFKILLTQLSPDAVQALPWDRRVSLAIVLAEAKRYEQAKTQLEHCLAEADEQRLRSLTTATLYGSISLMKAFGLSLPDKQLQDLALTLIPAELRGTL